jgi:restriction system protein
MARSFYSVVKQAARAADRANRNAIRQHERQHREMQRELQRQARESDRYAKQAARDARLQYLEDRQDEVEELNEQLQERVEELGSLLLAVPEAADPLDFRSLRIPFKASAFDSSKLGPAPRAPLPDQFRTEVQRPGLISRMFGAGAKYEAEVAAAASRDQQALQDARVAHEQDLAAWHEREAMARASHAQAEATRKAQADEHNAAIEQFERAYCAGDPDAVREYFSLVMERSVLPDGFPESFRLAYIPESRQLVVEHDLPTLDIVPAVGEYNYVKGKDEIREKPRKKGEIAELYRLVVASVALRILNEVFSSDAAETVAVAVFNGVVHTIHPGTGENISPCLISVRVTREDFSRIALERVDPLACLKTLNASVSKKAEELSPVRPVIEFDMVDRRFVAEEDVIGGIASRPNIMDLSPSEFESLVANLFKGMGLETRLTRSSRDGGVDAVAFDPRPVLGGKVVIQAKRYKNTVGVSAVRDLYGTMMNEGANKGILVTTAGYGPDAFAFAKDKPVELIDGSGLLYLLEQQGIEARIVMPV